MPKFVPREKNVGQLRSYVFSKNTPPILEVELGEKFVAETEDALNGLLREDPGKLHPRDTAPYSTHVPGWSNPLCGPVFVKGVEPGDVLVVNVEKMDKILVSHLCLLTPFSHQIAESRSQKNATDAAPHNSCDEEYPNRKAGTSVHHCHQLKPVEGDFSNTKANRARYCKDSSYQPIP